MPRSWTSKEERQYEHIREGAQKRGKSAARAKAIAARTVNKRRRQKGETGNKTTQGTGNPNVPLQDRKVAELRNIAQDLDIRGRSGMRKDDLVRAIRKKR